MTERNSTGQDNLTNSTCELGLVMLRACKTLDCWIEKYEVEDRAGNSAEMFGEGCDGEIPRRSDDRASRTETIPVV